MENWKRRFHGWPALLHAALPAAGRTGELQLKFRFKFPEKKNYKTESIKYKKMGAERQFGFFFCLLVLITESELVPQLQQSSAFLYS